ncbi:flagellar filament capping protein FliD [Bacillaceae bacterium W0354]
MRIGGLATGMDIDQLVGDLMKAERIPLVKMQQDRTWLTWQRDAYREVNTMFLDFRSQLTQMKTSSTFRARTTSSTNDGLVTATATSAAGQTSYTISEVKQLASAATKVNNDTIFKDPKSIDSRKSLAELESAFFNDSINWSIGSTSNQTVRAETATNQFQLELANGVQLTNDYGSQTTIKVNGKKYEVVTDPNATLTDQQVLVTQDGQLTFKEPFDKGTIVDVSYVANKRVQSFSFTEKDEGKDTIQLNRTHLVSDAGEFTIAIDGTSYSINGTNIEDGGGNVIGTVDYAKGQLKFNDENFLAEKEVEVSFKERYTSFSLGSHTKDGYKEEIFNISSSRSFSGMISDINRANTGVNLFYDDMTGKMTLTRTETGQFNDSGDEIVVTGDFANRVLRFDQASETGGANAIFTINGLETQRYSNNFEVNGVQFQLKQEFSGENVSVNVSNDTEKVFENIKSFVEKYNELIGSIQEKTQEKRYRDYKPLTDEQYEDMSEKQAELWEEKAKSGLLRSDQTLNSALTSMRRDFYTSVENSEVNNMMKQLASIGIKTTTRYLDGGKLEIDEAKLKSAIENDPESVEKLFTANGSTYEQKGILHRLTDTVTQTMDTITNRAGNSFRTEQQYTLGRRLVDLNDRIGNFEDRLMQVEDRYWRQFTAMEKAIQRMNQQSMYLMQQFGGGMQ